jgi:hypothetical protein
LAVFQGSRYYRNRGIDCHCKFNSRHNFISIRYSGAPPSHPVAKYIAHILAILICNIIIAKYRMIYLYEVDRGLDGYILFHRHNPNNFQTQNLHSSSLSSILGSKHANKYNPLSTSAYHTKYRNPKALVEPKSHDYNFLLHLIRHQAELLAIYLPKTHSQNRNSSWHTLNKKYFRLRSQTPKNPRNSDQCQEEQFNLLPKFWHGMQ